MSWSNVRLDNGTGAGGRPFTWKWPWSKQVTVHLGGYYSPDPILGASEAAATLAHELGHAVDFAGGWFGTAAGALKDQTLYTFGGNVYNPSLRGSLGVEGRATAYEWSYRLYYGNAPNPLPSNYPVTSADQVRLYQMLYP